jgi:alpha-beta hydrolase superfamily lysophospholipase
VLRHLVEHGLCVLAPSLRAHGDAEGDVNDVGLSARKDVVSAVEFLEGRAPQRGKLIFGRSFGAAAAIFAGPELGTRVRGYILESPFRDLETAIENRMELFFPRLLAPVAARTLVIIGEWVLPFKAKDVRPIDYVGRIPEPVPILFVAGEADTRARLFEVQALKDRVASHATLEVFPGANHGQARMKDEARYWRLVLGFLSARNLGESAVMPHPVGTVKRRPESSSRPPAHW